MHKSTKTDIADPLCRGVITVIMLFIPGYSFFRVGLEYANPGSGSIVVHDPTEQNASAALLVVKRFDRIKIGSFASWIESEKHADRS